MVRVLFASSHGELRGDVRRLLAGLDIAPTVDISAAADPAARARLAFARTGEPCIVEQLELAGGAARIVVVLADGDGTHVYTGAVSGRLPAGGGEDAFVPEGLARSLGELGDAAYLAGPRHAPYLELAHRLRGRDYRGAFEAHVTVRPPAGGIDGFRAACERLGASCVAIELPAGDTPGQPMTASTHHGDLRTVQGEVHAQARALLVDGFDVVRTKIEALPANADIPISDDDAAAVPHNYFEYHLQLVLPRDADLAAIAGRCEPHGARLSRNARSVRTDGAEARFVTLRVRAGLTTADARAAALEAALVDVPGARIAKRICEYTVYDSDLAIDRGWL